MYGPLAVVGRSSAEDLMKIHDISMTVSPDMVYWPDTTVPTVEWEMRMSSGDIGDVSRWVLGAHNGTHVDAPSHFLAGEPGLEAVTLESLVGPAVVVELPDEVRSITADDIPWSDVSPAERLLFKTSNSRQRLDGSRFDESYVGIEPDAARAIVAAGMKLVGIDYLSVETFGREVFETHHVLLGARVTIVEGLDLRDVEPGRYLLTILPLKLAGAEAAPARAILEEPDP